MCRNLSKAGQKYTSLRKVLIRKLRSKKEMHRQWKQGEVTLEKYRNVVWTPRDEVRKAMAKLGNYLERDVNKK